VRFDNDTLSSYMLSTLVTILRNEGRDTICKWSCT